MVQNTTLQCCSLKFILEHYTIILSKWQPCKYPIYNRHQGLLALQLLTVPNHMHA
ncbi:hypothetical protein DsansV1_C29g0208171 [Dioscorea sansibarensis]